MRLHQQNLVTAPDTFAAKRRGRLLRTLTCLFALAASAAPWAAADEAQVPADEPAWLRQDQVKEAHLRRTVAELRRRTPAQLSAEQAARRKELIDALERYRVRGEFTRNRAFPGLAIPIFIDKAGTRCALAHLIDVSGADALLEALVAQNNHAFLPSVANHEELRRWLESHGLTLDDAALIQGPGNVDPVITPAPNAPEGEGPGSLLRAVTSSAPSQSFTLWSTWWSLNRHAYVNLREAYHEGGVVTPRPGDTQDARPRDVEMAHRLRPFLAHAATNPSDVQATALMAYARTAGKSDAPAVLAALDSYLGDKGRPYRDMLVLGLGLVDSPLALKRLTHLVRDDREGRTYFRHEGTLPQSVRSYAAFALAQTGNAAAAEVLTGVLRTEKKGLADLRASAIHALGNLAPAMPARAREATSAFLQQALEKRSWPRAALGAVPRALLRLGTAAGRGTVLALLQHFRKPVEARQGAAIALADLSRPLDGSTADVLISSVRRDPDAITRQGALLSLGALAGQPLPTAATRDQVQARTKIMRVLEGALQGMHVQSSDRGSAYLATALAARTRPREQAKLAPDLERALSQEAHRSHRDALLLSLGLLGELSARPLLQKALKKGAHPTERSYAAEALGLLRDREARPTLLKLLAEDASEAVRYRSALGLGLQADRQVVAALLSAWADARSDLVRTALSRVLGELGDRTALLPLMRIAGDAKADDWSRRRALSALGALGENRDIPWMADLQRSAIAFSGTPTLQTVLALY